MRTRRLAAALAAVTLGWTASAMAMSDGVFRDMSEGYNDTVVVTLTVRGGRIVDLAAENRSGAEPSEYMQSAIDGLRERILEKQGVEGVDAVSGATGSSQSILTAAAGALEQAAVTADAGGGAAGGTAGGPGGSTTGEVAGGVTIGADGTNGTNGVPGADGVGMAGGGTSGLDLSATDATMFAGLGGVANFRVGPGKDDTGAQVYSFNVVMAAALFDRDGRVMNVRVDVYEVSTPNYDGDSMPHFSGWPGKEGYNVYDGAQGKVTGVSRQTEETAAAEVSGWVTKRERGDQYGMNPQNDWHKQMDAYERWMAGKTMAEIRDWFGRFASAKNGRPIKLDSADEDDRKKLAAMSDAEKQALADVTSMATMSLSDGHGLILEAIEKAYANRAPVEGADQGS